MLGGISYFVKMGTSKSLHLWKESVYAISKVLDFLSPSYYSFFSPLPPWGEVGLLT